MKKKTVNVKLSDLREYPNNNKIHGDNVKHIAKSITRNGYITPIIIDENNEILAGHGRKLALEQLGQEEVEVIQVTGLTDKQKRDFRIVDNKTAELSEWNLEAIEFELKELDIDELSELFPEIDLNPIDYDEDKEDEVPDMEDKPIIVERGDIFQLGDHRLMCGDSTDIEDVEGLMDGELCDQVITDPPYNVDYVGKSKKSLAMENDKKSDSDFRQFLQDAFSCVVIYMKDGAVFYVWHADSEGYNFRGALLDSGLKTRQCLIWNKNSMVMGRQDYHWKHEPCLYGRKDGAGHLWNSDRRQTTILNFDRPVSNSVHPTMKPVELIEYQVTNNTKGGDLVLDTFLGSGTTLIACEKTKRKCYGMELDPKYIQVIIKRYHNYTKGQKEIKCLTRELDLSPIIKDDQEEDRQTEN